ncbi:hypothetical protein DFR29_109163 [Tahibacter aquaticus]|uniref:PD-(D/E)XK nuclease superfamily protein n=1 Tax=Tahibacter aquaticus TaxID=520092 RepID=A0A4R6YUT5_9GAMM|nr:hypothetical protein [Tahibacter aquaticus]TDR42107.1 hypothetical protein DFR29_109163 [Tahibacter aquaticus]
MTEQKCEDEKQLESELCKRILPRDPHALEQVRIDNSTSDARNLADLIGDKDFELLADTSNWNQHKNVLIDITGNMTPDVVIRSTSSGENRTIIEVKYTHVLGYGRADSQVIRYFLHLLATTLQRKNGGDIRRALILAAPDSWFENRRNSEDWGYFMRTYKDIAGAFDITLGEIRLPLPVAARSKLSISAH